MSLILLSMRSVIVLVGYLLITELVYSQSFISETKLWSNVVHGTEYGSSFESFYIKMNGDSSISDHTYSKVYRSDDSLQLQWILEGFVRETDSGSVFYLPRESSIEIW